MPTVGDDVCALATGKTGDPRAVQMHRLSVGDPVYCSVEVLLAVLCCCLIEKPDGRALHSLLCW